MNKKYFAIACCILSVSLLFISGCDYASEDDSQSLPEVTSEAMFLDANVTKNVEMALKKDMLLRGFNINVVTTNGNDELIGLVNSQEQIDAAIKIAEHTKGTQVMIINELTIKS